MNEPGRPRRGDVAAKEVELSRVDEGMTDAAVADALDRTPVC